MMKPSSNRFKVFSLPRERRHTFHFLQYAEQFKSVYLDTEIDMTEILKLRQKAQRAGQRIGYTTFIIKAVACSLRQFPEANVSVSDGWYPRMAQYTDITARFTMDKTCNRRRMVLSGIISDADHRSISEIQNCIDYYRDKKVEDIPEFSSIRKLQAIPISIGKIIYNALMGNLDKRNKLMGTFTITSLGHRPIQSFYPIISSTLCFGVGTVAEKPVVYAGQVRIRPVMKLSLAFDHRAIDGALAADILAEVKNVLETNSEIFINLNEEKEVCFIGSST